MKDARKYPDDEPGDDYAEDYTGWANLIALIGLVAFIIWMML